MFYCNYIYTEDGKLWTIGENNYGQFKKFPNPPILSNIDPEIKQMSGDCHNTMTLKKNGQFVFNNVPTLSHQNQIESIHLYKNYILMIKYNGDVLSGCHVDKLTKIKINDQNTINYKKEIIILKNNKSIVFDSDNFEIITSDSNLKQIINGNSHQILINDENILFNGKYFATHIDVNFEDSSNDLTNIKQICSGADHTLILKKNGELWGIGFNKFGQLGLKDTINRNEPELIMKDPNISKIACGFNWSFFLKNNNELWYCGCNIYAFTLLKFPDNSKIIGINDQMFGNINWKPNLFQYSSKEYQNIILIFLLVCKYYEVYHKVKMVKYMKIEIIKYLFY